MLIDGKQLRDATVTAAKLASGVGGGKPGTGNKNMAASTTAADFAEACATAMAATPFGDSYVQVLVNGCMQVVGDGVKTKDCYFSADAGTTAKTIATIASGDKLYWVGSVAGFELAAATDKVDFLYDI